jgi:hypothetical protein
MNLFKLLIWLVIIWRPSLLAILFLIWLVICFPDAKPFPSLYIEGGIISACSFPFYQLNIKQKQVERKHEHFGNTG